MGHSIEPQRGRVGVSWIRLLTDLPTAIVEASTGRLEWRDYLGSLKNVDVEAVFDHDDLLPGFIELAFVPYLMLKRGF